jgi:flavin reductase (DIM6/NTAB) family NADH-FMN oxidoreductase RutF
MNGEPFRPGKTNAPILSSPPAYVECRLRGVAGEAGDHAVVLLEVVEAEWRAAAKPLTIAESPWEYGG